MTPPPALARAPIRSKINNPFSHCFLLLILECLFLLPLGTLADAVATDHNASTYVLAEDFEGPGFENTGWFKTGTPDEDYTTIALHGAQSLHCVGGQYISRGIAFSNS